MAHKHNLCGRFASPASRVESVSRTFSLFLSLAFNKGALAFAGPVGVAGAGLFVFGNCRPPPPSLPFI